MKGSSLKPRKVLGQGQNKISFNTVTSIVNSTQVEGSGLVKNVAQGKINKTFYQKKLSSEPRSRVSTSRPTSNNTSVLEQEYNPQLKMNRDLGEMTVDSSQVDHAEIKLAGEVTERLSHEEDSESTTEEKDPEKAGKERGEEGSGNAQLRDSWRRKSLLMKRPRNVGFGSSARRDTPPQLDAQGFKLEKPHKFYKTI